MLTHPDKIYPGQEARTPWRLTPAAGCAAPVGRTQADAGRQGGTKLPVEAVRRVGWKAKQAYSYLLRIRGG